MISFRFYVVSIIAVFLAIALGVVVGSTYVDRAIVDALNRRVRTVSQSLDDRRAVNQRLREEVARLEAYVQTSAPYAVSRRLRGTPVVVVVERGVDADTARQLVLLAQDAGAQVPGILWLERSWRLESDEDAERLGDALDLPDLAVGSLRRLAWARVVDELAGPVGVPAEGGEPPDEDPLGLLLEAGFLDYEDVGGRGVVGLGGSDVRVALVADARADPDGDAPPDPEAPGGVVDLAIAQDGEDVPTLVAEAWQGSEEETRRGQIRSLLQAANGLDDTVSTVDNVDTVQGRVAAVLALADLGDRVVGDYGYGEGADALLPEPAL